MKNLSPEEIEVGNALLAAYTGWEYFPKSKSSIDGYPFAGHDGFEEYEVWIRNPTQKYREILCHYGYDNIDDDLEKGDLFDDYAYSLKFHDSWDWIMQVTNKVISSGFKIPLIQSKDWSVVYISKSFTSTEPIISSKKSTLLEAYWSALVEFVKLQNQKSC